MRKITIIHIINNNVYTCDRVLKSNECYLVDDLPLEPLTIDRILKRVTLEL